MNRQRSIAVLLCAALSSCGLFDKDAIRDITGPTPTTARVKFHNFSPSSVGVNFFANDVKMTALSSTRCTAPVPADTAVCRTAGIESTTGVVYGTCTAGACIDGPAAGGLYLAIPTGQQTLTARMAAKDTIVATVSQTIEDGKYYSFFMSGIYNTTAKTADAFVIEDPIPPEPIDFTVAHVRFVNAISNATGALNLFATNTTTTTETAVGGAVAYKAAGTYVTLPAGTYDLRARYTGEATNRVSRNGVSLVGGRVYTITARGSTATASTLAFDFSQNHR